ncbi:MAG: sugar phosphate isomerase/epimerase [Clostridiales bacterium]|jgi:sugar phosphate isomerase/epimerase|nr:sugar phosphate isomerase/epimerase [Clostridiales bacterium]
MKIGICAPIGQLRQFDEMGFDYIEPAVVSLMDMDAGALGEARRILDGSRIKAEACNVLFPGRIALVGPDADPGAAESYLRDAVGRAAQIGAKCLVFGSGASRRAPAGFDAAAARSQLRDAIALAGEIARENGVLIAIEPLNAGETNQINSVSDGLRMAREIGMDSVGLLADFYHMRVEREPMSSLLPCGGALLHAHIARGEGRTYPLSGGEDIYGEFFAALGAIAYSGRVSIEGSSPAIGEDAPKSLAFLRACAAEAGL